MAKDLMGTEWPAELAEGLRSPYPRSAPREVTTSRLALRMAHGVVASTYAAAAIAVLIVGLTSVLDEYALPNFVAYAPIGVTLVAVAFIGGFNDRRLKPRASVLATVCGFVVGFFLTAPIFSASLLAPFIGGFVIGALAGIAGLVTQLPQA